MATHSSVLAWRIPGMGEPAGLLSMGSQSRTQLKRLSSNSSSKQLQPLSHGKEESPSLDQLTKRIVNTLLFYASVFWGSVLHSNS